MDELLKKLKALLEELADTPEDSDGKHRAETLSKYETDQLEELVKVASTELHAIDDPKELDRAASLKAARDILNEEVVSRREAAKEAADELAKIKADVPNPQDEAEEVEEAEEKEGAKAEAKDGDETEASDEDAEEVEEKTEEKQPVTASYSAAISTLDRRIEAESKPVTNLDVVATTTGPASGRTYSDQDGLEAVGEDFYKYVGQVTGGKMALAHVEFKYPEERKLSNSPDDNTRRLNSAVSEKAIVASGGICDPVPADFNHPICSDRGRPIRNGLPTFQLMRGGVRFAPAATIGDLSTAVSIWTEATDAAPGTETKPCPAVSCPEEVEVKVDAVTRCLTVGNFQARFNPEFWQSRLDLLLVEHDRAAEQNSFDQIVAGSTAVTASDFTGTIQNVLIALDTAASGIRSRHRVSQQTAIRAILPDWIEAALRVHLAEQNPGGRPEQYAAAMDNWYAARNIRPIFSPDTEPFGAQGAGALVDFPQTITVPVFPEGSWVFGDGGSLDLGTQVTDSTLNETNDRQAFAETFEVTFFRGCESLAVDIALGDGCICLTAGT